MLDRVKPALPVVLLAIAVSVLGCARAQVASVVADPATAPAAGPGEAPPGADAAPHRAAGARHQQRRQERHQRQLRVAPNDRSYASSILP